jgi:hypothetical protein
MEADMGERLRQSRDALKPPTCPDCSVPMSGYHSIFVSVANPSDFAHFFQCPQCNRIQEARSLADPSRVSGPSKLAPIVPSRATKRVGFNLRG